MLRLESVTKSFGGHEVLKDLSWAVPPAARIGLVGRNGSGKSTLLKIIVGEEEADSGTVSRPGDATFGYLPQEGARVVRGTVLESLLAAFPEVRDLEDRLAESHEAMARAQGRELEALTRRVGELQHRFEAAGGYRLESEARRILTGLGFDPSIHSRPLAEMSGGYRMRASLGALLMLRPDYLLLDEPTNHLDLDAVAWLEGFLGEIDSALIMVSHDRVFLNRLASGIADLGRGGLTTYAGNYDAFRVEKEAARERALSAAVQESKRVAEVERFVERFRYKASKARQVQSRIKMLEKMKRTEVAPEERTWRFLLPRAPRSASLVLSFQNVTKSFGRKAVLGGPDGGIDLELRRGDRVALMGANGTGKSTLLKIAAGLLPPDGGKVATGEKVVMHYLAQHVHETLRGGRTVLEEMQSWAPDRRPGELRSLLGIFQFTGDDAFKTVDVLSGGEKNRLAMARLMLDPGNLILLDEPTNHLDLPAREALEEAFAGFDGTLVLVSHDRYFINKIATRIAVLADGKLTIHDGDYEAYTRSRAQPAAPAQPAPPEPGRKGKERKRLEAERRNARSRNLRDIKKRVQDLEESIGRSESRLAEIESLLADPATYSDKDRPRELGTEKKSLEEDLSRLNREWESAQTRLEAEPDK